MLSDHFYKSHVLQVILRRVKHAGILKVLYVDDAVTTERLLEPQIISGIRYFY